MIAIGRARGRRATPALESFEPRLLPSGAKAALAQPMVALSPPVRFVEVSPAAAEDRSGAAKHGYLVSLRVVESSSQDMAFVTVRDHRGHLLGSGRVPLGQGADDVTGGPVNRAADLAAAAFRGPTISDSALAFSEIASALAAASQGDSLDTSIILLTPEDFEIEPKEPVTTSATTSPLVSHTRPQGVATSAHEDELDVPLPVPGAVVRVVAPAGVEAVASREVESEPGEEPTEAEVMVEGDGLVIVAQGRQVEVPGGLAPEEGQEGTAPAASHGHGERRRPRPEAASRGPVVVSSILAAGLIVPNVVLMGGPRRLRGRMRRSLSLRRREQD